MCIAEQSFPYHKIIKQFSSRICLESVRQVSWKLHWFLLGLHGVYRLIWHLCNPESSYPGMWVDDPQFIQGLLLLKSYMQLVGPSCGSKAFPKTSLSRPQLWASAWIGTNWIGSVYNPKSGRLYFPKLSAPLYVPSSMLFLKCHIDTHPTRGGASVPSLWAWADFCDCLDKKNVVILTLCDFRG